MRKQTIAALAALSMFGSCALIVATTVPAKAAEKCTPQAVTASQIVGDKDYTREQSETMQYCNPYAVSLGDVTAVVAEPGRMMRDFMAVLTAVMPAVNERFAVMSENVRLMNDAMHFRREAETFEDRYPLSTEWVGLYLVRTPDGSKEMFSSDMPFSRIDFGQYSLQLELGMEALAILKLRQTPAAPYSDTRAQLARYDMQRLVPSWRRQEDYGMIHIPYQIVRHARP